MNIIYERKYANNYGGIIYVSGIKCSLFQETLKNFNHKLGGYYMLIVVSAIAIALIVVGIIMISNGKYETEQAGTALFAIGVFFLFASLIGGSFVGAHLATSHTIDEQIALYEQENRIIEEKVEASVNAYLEHEQKTIQPLTPENATTYVSFIPELNSDSVVSRQINTYLANHQSIMTLKVKKINLVKYKWWLYFGS